MKFLHLEIEPVAKFAMSRYLSEWVAATVADEENEDQGMHGRFEKRRKSETGKNNLPESNHKNCEREKRGEGNWLRSRAGVVGKSGRKSDPQH